LRAPDEVVVFLTTGTFNLLSKTVPPYRLSGCVAVEVPRLAAWDALDSCCVMPTLVAPASRRKPFKLTANCCSLSTQSRTFSVLFCSWLRSWAPAPQRLKPLRGAA